MAGEERRQRQYSSTNLSCTQLYKHCTAMRNSYFCARMSNKEGGDSVALTVLSAARQISENSKKSSS